MESFHEGFCNTLSDAEAAIAFEETATHDSRNVLRDYMLGPGHIGLDLPHVPFLFVTGEEDHIIPHELVEKNSKAYKDETSSASFKSFPGRSHYICGEPSWEEVPATVATWLESVNR